jgi:hypothetical protein
MGKKENALREFLLRYLGWCPGFKSAVDFTPKDSPRKNTLTIFIALTVLLSIIGYALYGIILGTPDDVLEVHLIEVSPTSIKTFSDSEFNESFNYEKLWEKRVRFYDQVYKSDYGETQYETVNRTFRDLNDIRGFLAEQRIPNVVIGFTMYLMDVEVSNGSRPSLGKILGDLDGVEYDVIVDHTYSNTISIRKIANLRTLWRVYLDYGEIYKDKYLEDLDDPAYHVRMIKYRTG